MRSKRNRALLAASLLSLGLPSGCMPLVLPSLIEEACSPAPAPLEIRPATLIDVSARRCGGGFHVVLTYEEGSRREWDLLRPEPREVFVPTGDPGALALAEGLFELASQPGPPPPRVVPCAGGHVELASEPLPRSPRPGAMFTGLHWAPGFRRAIVHEGGEILGAVGGDDGVLVAAERADDPPRYEAAYRWIAFPLVLPALLPLLAPVVAHDVIALPFALLAWLEDRW